MTAIENWVRHFRHYGDLDSVLTLYCNLNIGNLNIGLPRSGAYFGLVLFAVSKISIFGF